ncbi:MAG: ABC transporter ATP-binding protein [Bacteroidetes bacterium]|nr:ABC transporter ATP-binding protein [Bacteroidota bacterium]
MSDTVIKVENLSKQYRLGEVGTGTLSHDLNRWWARLRGKEDPFLKIGETNDREQKGNSDYVWALRDINFEVQQGEVLGIIGRNGAGKSTLLKILSKTTAPTTGKIKVKGRIASLLEVGTGFHPEMTGRENIFLNGAILGMTKKEIQKKFDEIVDFAGVERYVDTPVKRYSSGMYVRLAFAVAAFLEPEILIVDEVLAVGDAEFQKKCLGRMKDVSVNDGRTVLFVSHNMGTISQLCNKTVLLGKGQLVTYDKTTSVIGTYLMMGKSMLSNKYTFPSKNFSKEYYFVEIFTINQNGEETDQFGFDDSIFIICSIKANSKHPNVKIGFNILNSLGNYVSTSIIDLNYENQISESVYRYKIKIQPSILAPNTYMFRFAIFLLNDKIFDLVENECQIKINDTGTQFASFEGTDYGNVILDYHWEFFKL